MSAYIVSDRTISVVAKGLVDYGIEVPVHFNDSQTIFINERYQPVGQWLVKQNYRSVNARYEEQIPVHEFRYTEPEDFNEGILLGCMNCYEYQACETEDYERNTVHDALDRLEYAMLVHYITRSGYRVPWGLE